MTTGHSNRNLSARRRGSALLMVLWISAALAGVSLSLSTTVRGDGERGCGEVDSMRAYYTAAGGSGGSSFSTGPTFQGPAASFQEIEELISAPGVTPEILYGTYVPILERPQEGQPRLIRRSGLVDCLSMFGSGGAVEVNTADP